MKLSLLVGLLFVVLCSSCRPNVSRGSKNFDRSQLEQKQKLYCELSKPMYDQAGYAVSKCDGLLFTALHGLACDYVNLDHFEGSVDGLWFRSPQHDCYIGKDNGAKSTISKDMFRGATLYWLVKGDKQAAQRTYDYGKDNKWVMGEPKNLIGHVIMTPTLRSVLRAILGKPFSTYPMVSSGKGYTSHLAAIRILTMGLAQGYVNNVRLNFLKKMIDRSPNNGLYHAIYNRFKDGDQSRAYELLMNEKTFPNDSLPTSKNYCTDYLYQREEAPKDWAPCYNESHGYYGTDFLFASWVILNGFNR